MNSNTSYTDEYSEKGFTTDDEYRCINAKENDSFMQDTFNDRKLDTKFGMSFRNSFHEPTKRLVKGNEECPVKKITKAESLKITEKKVKPIELQRNNKETQRTFIQLEKKLCELPLVSLTESDENYLMDTGVKLKYGDAKSFSEISRSLEAHLFNDYPLETFLQRTEILDGALDILVQTVDMRTFNNCIFLLNKFIDCVIKWKEFTINPYNVHPETNKDDLSSEQEHIVCMYPSKGSKRWDEIKFNLCNIAVECLYSCQNEDKIGSSLTVYRNVINTLNQLYEHSIDKLEDVIIKILNGFDNVLSYFNTLSVEGPVRTILLESISAIKISNRIFYNDDYKSNNDKCHPKTKLLISATCKLQQELRKALFNCTFEEQGCAEPISDFFKLKCKVDKKDEFVSQSYSKALAASSIYENSGKFRLNMADNEEKEITSASEFSNLLQIMEELLLCIELCLDFPFEKCLLNIIEYSELMEQSYLESSLEQVVKLFSSYFKIPIMEIRIRIIKKMIMRLQLREELLKLKSTEIKSKFLVKFLVRPQIVKLLFKEILLSSISNEEENPDENELINSVLQLCSVLLSCGDINDRRKLAQSMSSFQVICGIYQNEPSFSREIKYIMDSVEDCFKYRSVKQLRILRDLFSKNNKDREVATHILRKNWERHEIEDILKETFDLSSCSDDVFIELNIYSSGKTDYSLFDYDNLYYIFTNNPECSLKKSAIEQLSILINDRTDSLGISGRRLFREKKKGYDVFSICIQQIFTLYSDAQSKGVNKLQVIEQNYLQELLRFLTLSLIFYFDEPVVSELIKPYLEIEDSEEFESTTLSSLIDSLRLFLSSKQLEIRKNALRCLQVILLHDHVKICIDMSSGLPYFSLPTYCIKSYEYLFPIRTYRFTLINKISLLNPEEKSMVQINIKNKERANSNKRNKISLPEVLSSQAITNENWFNIIECCTAKDTFEVLSSEVFMKLISNKSSINVNEYQQESKTPIKDLFEIVPSDLNSAKDLSMFYTNLKVLLRDIGAKINLTQGQEQMYKGIKAFYLLVITRMKEINLPYHYIYSQIVDVGIENRQTCHLGPLKLTEYACYLVEAFYNMIDILMLLIETDKAIFEKFNLSINCSSELINFDDKQQKGLICDLINLCIFLKEKGEPLRNQLLKLTSIYIDKGILSGNTEQSKLLDKIGTFAIDTIASKKLNQEFYSNYSTMLSLQVLSKMIQVYSFSITDKLKNANTLEGLSETGIERISSFNTLGWLARFTQHRDSRIRFMTWDLLGSLVSLNLIKQHPTLIDQSFECFLNEYEIYSCKISSLSFICKVSELLLSTESFLNQETNLNKSELDENERNPITMSYIIKCVEKYMFLSKFQNLLYQETIPAIFVNSVIRFLKCLKCDFKNCIPIFTTLDIWSTLSKFLKPNLLMKKYASKECSECKDEISKEYFTQNEASLFDAFVLNANAIIQMVLESAKNDQNVSSIIVRSVPFIESLLKCLAFTLKNINRLTEQTGKQACDTMFYSAMTLMQYFLYNAEEDTIRAICRLFKLTSKLFKLDVSLGFDFGHAVEETTDDEYEHFWPLLIEILDNTTQLEVHYTTIKFASSLIKCFVKYSNSTNHLESSAQFNSEGESYGSLICYKFLLLFKKVYFPKKNEKQDFPENFKNDLCVCLCILLQNSEDSRTIAVKENLVNKLIDKAHDLCNAYRIGAFQNSKKPIDKDSKFFERECIRILKILKCIGDFMEHENIEKDSASNSIIECPSTVHKLVDIYDLTSHEAECAIFNEIGEVLSTFISRSLNFKKCCSLLMKGKKCTPMRVILKSLKALPIQSKNNEIKLIFNLATSLCMISENIRTVIKDKIIEDIASKLVLMMKSEKDILNNKGYITHFIKFCAAFTYCEEGVKAIMNYNQVFDLVLFCLENLTPPSSNESDMILQLFVNLMLFIGNSSAFKKNKIHFLSNPKFLANILTILSSNEFPLKVKAFAAQTLCVTLHNHQAIKAVWSKQIHQGIEEIKTYLENYDEQDFDSLYDNIVFNTEDEKVAFLRLQSDYKQICIDALVIISKHTEN